jgi:hypothetical protein
MNDAHAYEMQVQMWKPNTWGVTHIITCNNLEKDHAFANPQVFKF